MIVIVAMAVVVRMMMALVEVIVTVLMGMAGPIGMNMLVLLASADERRDFGRTARPKIGQRRGRAALAAACCAHQTNSSISMLLMFSSSPLTR